MTHRMPSIALGFLLSVPFAMISCGTLRSAKAPPPGFSALFNNKDLTGWWGAETEDPRKYMALPPEQFKDKHDQSLKDIEQHWRVENDELINDGKGLYLTTDKFYGDFELLVDYRTVPSADIFLFSSLGCSRS